jgi:hypothetical protein
MPFFAKSGFAAVGVRGGEFESTTMAAIGEFPWCGW